MRLCNRCKDIQETCCQGSIIPLTRGDIERITRASGTSDFFIYTPCLQPTPTDIQDYGYDPNWLQYTILKGSFHRLLKRDENKKCVFLSDHGCTLSEDTRPLICRLYPYSYNEFGMIGLVLNENLSCPLHLLKEGETPADVLEINSEEGECWRAQLYRELREEYNENQQRSEALAC
jgi:uncharacterized protein